MTMNVKWILAALLLCVLSAGCGEINPMSSSTSTLVGCAAQTAGSTVSILDAKPSC